MPGLTVNVCAIVCTQSKHTHTYVVVFCKRNQCLAFDVAIVQTHGNNIRYGHALRMNVMSGGSGHTVVVETLTTTGLNCKWYAHAVNVMTCYSCN